MNVNAIEKEALKNLIGKHIYAVKKDGTVITGKLMSIKGNELIIAPQTGKEVKVSAFIPLVLFDLLAIGTAPFAFGPFGGFGFGSPFFI